MLVIKLGDIKEIKTTATINIASGFVLPLFLLSEKKGHYNFELEKSAASQALSELC